MEAIERSRTFRVVIPFLKLRHIRNRQYVRVIDHARGLDGWILAKFFFLRSYGPRLRLGP